ncbi:hypothetical protein GPJ56_004269 [Histomonas meleagridis]|uniref:uncharacterized protein n=1 Tax=Histomonas meleagridis TaxID=135588 RepID=UPI0035595FAF|nr:hypothetical protein GPJ56_004269 [Histomonas meleagridis]KAH0800517.1 hypothetical protein GO595_006720 [Histomonas meleagridis]
MIFIILPLLLGFSKEASDSFDVMTFLVGGYTLHDLSTIFNFDDEEVVRILHSINPDSNVRELFTAPDSLIYGFYRIHILMSAFLTEFTDSMIPNIGSMFDAFSSFFLFANLDVDIVREIMYSIQPGMSILDTFAEYGYNLTGLINIFHACENFLGYNVTFDEFHTQFGLTSSQKVYFGNLSQVLSTITPETRITIGSITTIVPLITLHLSQIVNVTMTEVGPLAPVANKMFNFTENTLSQRYIYWKEFYNYFSTNSLIEIFPPMVPELMDSLDSQIDNLKYCKLTADILFYDIIGFPFNWTQTIVNFASAILEPKNVFNMFYDISNLLGVNLTGAAVVPLFEIIESCFDFVTNPTSNFYGLFESLISNLNSLIGIIITSADNPALSQLIGAINLNLNSSVEEFNNFIQDLSNDVPLAQCQSQNIAPIVSLLPMLGNFQIQMLTSILSINTTKIQQIQPIINVLQYLPLPSLISMIGIDGTTVLNYVSSIINSSLPFLTQFGFDSQKLQNLIGLLQSPDVKLPQILESQNPGSSSIITFISEFLNNFLAGGNPISTLFTSSTETSFINLKSFYETATTPTSTITSLITSLEGNGEYTIYDMIPIDKFINGVKLTANNEQPLISSNIIRNSQLTLEELQSLQSMYQLLYNIHTILPTIIEQMIPNINISSRYQSICNLLRKLRQVTFVGVEDLIPIFSVNNETKYNVTKITTTNNTMKEITINYSASIKAEDGNELIINNIEVNDNAYVSFTNLTITNNLIMKDASIISPENMYEHININNNLIININIFNDITPLINLGNYQLINENKIPKLINVSINIENLKTTEANNLFANGKTLIAARGNFECSKWLSVASLAQRGSATALSLRCTRTRTGMETDEVEEHQLVVAAPSNEDFEEGVLPELAGGAIAGIVVGCVLVVIVVILLFVFAKKANWK